MSRSVHHVGLVVSDLARSQAFYELLGFEGDIDTALTVDADWARTVLAQEALELRVLFMALEGTTLELLEYVAPVGAKAPPGKVNDAGTAHIAISVDDVPAEHARLVEAGVSFISDPVAVSEGDLAGLGVVYGHDPDGNTFELLSGL